MRQCCSALHWRRQAANDRHAAHVTALPCFAGPRDFYLRAFDSATGKEIWKARLPVGSQSGPMSYVSPKSGRQYIVVNAGGARQSPKRGDDVITCALPNR
jgi:quinate dehydrogenase (quinone)